MHRHAVDPVRPVILARQPSTGAAPPSVHVWRIAADGTETCWSACGVSASFGALEHVDRFTGAPCLICWLSAISATDIGEQPVDQTSAGQEPVDQRVAAAAPSRRPEPGVARAEVTAYAQGRTYAYTPDLGDDEVVHLADPHGIRAHRADIPVVQAMCGHVGRGLLEHAPDGAIVCDECAEAAV